MSAIGATINHDDLIGKSWCLVAQTAINHSDDRGTGASGIMAASADICAMILAGDIEHVFAFPPSDSPAGLYLWHGLLDDEGDFTGVIERLHPDSMQYWINANGERL